MSQTPFAAAGTRRPLHPLLVPVVGAFFVGALLTDLLYIATVNTQWETFSVWLLTVGLLVAACAGAALLFDLASRGTSFRPAWLRVLACVVGALLELVNAFIHSRDGYTAVVPSGVTLSAVVTLIVLFLGYHRWTLGDRRRRLPAD